MVGKSRLGVEKFPFFDREKRVTKMWMNATYTRERPRAVTPDPPVSTPMVDSRKFIYQSLETCEIP